MLQQTWTPSGKGCAVYLWSLPAWWWVRLREEPHLFCIAPAQHTALLEHQVPACRAWVGCWTERTVPFHVDSVGFCPAGEHCASFEAWFFSLYSWAKWRCQGEGAALWGMDVLVRQGRRDSSSWSSNERRFSALGHSHSECGCSLTGDCLPLQLEQNLTLNQIFWMLGLETRWEKRRK